MTLGYAARAPGIVPTTSATAPSYTTYRDTVEKPKTHSYIHTHRAYFLSL